MDTVDNLILDLLERMGPRPRPYVDVLEAWRTSCPRLPVWEEANDAASSCAGARRRYLGVCRRQGALADQPPSLNGLNEAAQAGSFA